MKKDMVMALEKIKPGEGKMEEVKTNMRKNANAANTTNKTRKNTNSNNTKTNTTKKGKQKVCIQKAKGVKCYYVENKNGVMTIEPIPG
jgi:predicted transcriptional regulator